MNSLQIRAADVTDKDALHALYLDAFPAGEGLEVGQLAYDLVAGESVPPTLSFVIGDKATVAAHIAFSPIFFKSKTHLKAYILGPLAVKSDHQRQGLGTALIDHGLQHLTMNGVHAVIVYGDPAYYGRQGFRTDLGAHFIPPFPLHQPFGWQAQMLKETRLRQAEYQFDCVPALNKPEYW